MIRLSTEHPVEYSPRLAGKVCAYFISSKDQNNRWKGAHNMEISYVDFVARTLYDGFDDYMCFHPDPYYVGFAANPDEDYSYDKRRLSEAKGLHQEAKALVMNAVKMAEKFRLKGYPKIEIGRVNRT